MTHDAFRFLSFTKDDFSEVEERQFPFLEIFVWRRIGGGEVDTWMRRRKTIGNVLLCSKLSAFPYRVTQWPPSTPNRTLEPDR